MNNYDDLIAAMSALSEKSTFDYLISIGPIVLSLIAIFISIYTVAKQNKIALFEKRCCVLNAISRIIWLSANIDIPEKLYIEDEKQSGKPYALVQRSFRVCATYNTMFGTELDYTKKDQEGFSIYASIYHIEKDLMMAEYLFGTEVGKLVFEMSGAMAKYMIDTVSQTENSSSKNQFCEKCSEFETKWIPKLEEKIRIRRRSHFMRG